MMPTVDFSLAARAAYDRLPGVIFLPRQPAGRPFLPRLDVAAFVGFAQRGPLNLPVPVEDFAAYEAIFGGDLALAQEAGRRIVYAHLPQAVRSFFANGGRRCYVVRVSGRRAEAARFRLPRVAALGGATGARPAAVSASSPGSWGAELRLATRLAVTPLWTAPANGDSTSQDSSKVFVWLPGQAAGAGFLAALAVNAAAVQRSFTPFLEAGDVLRLTLVDGSRWLAPIAAVETQPVAASVERQTKLPLVVVGLARLVRVVDQLVGSPPPTIARVDLLTIDGSAPLTTASDTPTSDRQQTVVTFAEQDARRLSAGDILRLQVVSSDGPVTGNAYLACVQDVLAASGSNVSSPPTSEFEIVLSELLQITPEDLLPASPASPPDGAQPFAPIQAVELLRFDLLVRVGRNQLPIAADLAFEPSHPRFWGNTLLLSSSMAVPQHGSANGAAHRSKWDRNAPLHSQPGAQATAASAGWFRDLVQDPYDLVPFPGELPDHGESLRAHAPAHAFSQAAALAGLLAPAGSSLGASWSEAQLDGYAAAQEELSLTYLPVGLPEIIDEGDPAQLRPPEPGHGGFDDLELFDPAVFWDRFLAPPGETHRTLLATAFDHHYLRGRRMRGMHGLLFIDEVAGVAVPDASHRLWEPRDAEPIPEPMPPEAPPTAAVCPQRADFASCNRPPVVSKIQPHFGPVDRETPVVIRGEGLTGDLQVLFGLRPAEAVVPRTVSELSATVPPGARPGAVDVRVTNQFGAGIARAGFAYVNASTARSLPVIVARGPNDRVEDEPFLAVHQALLALCQARSDALALLAVPQDYDVTQCLQWQAALRSRLGLPDLGDGFAFDEPEEIADLSYAAVYHPWLLVSDGLSADRVRPIPPEGAIAGLIAARDRERQAWIAPANLPLRTVLGLQSDVSEDDWAQLFAQRFNLVRAEANDFRPMSAHTLSGERRLLQISVRRLLILLRKAAEQVGMDFVFEPNDQVFREGVRVVLEELLRFLYERGAFAGRTEVESFRVITDDSANTPQSIEQGRFIAVIQVAPSQPMEFITVRMTRTGQGELLVVEA